ncbi:hypothetical protein KC338_g3776 [Hortaea werneckii]|nr:hypothetical protein KC323_g4237 [Hortaea werneckii]KAI6868868.1 hypothetical protein KC338_g3776 [Hortaea werneckii]
MPSETQTPEKTITPEVFKQHKAALTVPTKKNSLERIVQQGPPHRRNQKSPGHLQELLEMSDKLFDAAHPVKMTDPLAQGDGDADANINSIKNKFGFEDSPIFLGLEDTVPGEFGNGRGTRDGPGGVLLPALGNRHSKYRRDEPSDAKNDEIVSLKKELQEEREAGQRTRQQLREMLEREKKYSETKIQTKLKELKAELETGQGVVQGLQEE